MFKNQTTVRVRKIVSILYSKKSLSNLGGGVMPSWTLKHSPVKKYNKMKIMITKMSTTVFNAYISARFLEWEISSWVIISSSSST